MGEDEQEEEEGLFTGESDCKKGIIDADPKIGKKFNS
jgi:hypothetical protein